MNRSHALRALLVMACFITLPGWADDRPTTTVHRQMVGELDESGWAIANSTGGAFSVKTPGKFSDYSSVATDPKSTIAETHTIVATTLQGIKFTATRIKFRGGKEVAMKQFNNLKLTDGKVKYKSLKPMKMNTFEAMEGELEDARSSLIQRTVLLDSELMTLIVEYPKSEDTVARRLVPTYFASLLLE